MFWIISVLIQIITLLLLIGALIFKKQKHAKVPWWFILILSLLMIISAFSLGVQIAIF